MVIVLLTLDIFCLVDLYRAEEASNLPKWAWAVLIIVVHLLGAIGYLIFGRNRHNSVAGTGLT